MNNNWHKKEKPLLGLTGLGGGVDGLSVVGAATKAYVDDLFSTFLYTGNNSSRTLNVGIDFTTDGGATFIKNRTDSSAGDARWCVFDTVRGNGYLLHTNNTDAEANSTARQNNFSTTGFDVGAENETNGNNDKMTSFNFKKKKGFFDVVTYTGDGASSKTISHSLGSIPGLIIIKCTSHSGPDWVVWHRDFGSTEFLKFNENSAKATDNEKFGGSGSVLPTATTFTIGISNDVNGSSRTYVAYVFAGGASDAATAKSVDFDGTDDQLNIPDSTDWDLGNGDFTLETWIKSTQSTSGYYTALGQWVDSGNNRSWMIRYASQDIGTGWSFFYSTDGSNYTTTMGSDISDGQWHHVAVTRTGGNLRTFTDGILNTTRSTSDTFYAGAGTFTMGGQSGNYFDGQLSNVRLVKGTALYTSSFRPPTAPLSNVTNTKLLCCNDSSTTGSTVTPGTITTSSSPSASTDSPFDDPAGFKFGDSKEGTITCGSYSGNSTANHEIYLGWEPQWWLVKNVTDAQNWQLLDSMRGWVSDGNDQYLVPNNTSADSAFNFGNPTPTGFNLSNASSNWQNESGKTYVYMAIRRPDGYVGKPVELGTDVFTMDVAGSTSPAFDSGFPVDLALVKNPSSTDSWDVAARLIQNQNLKPTSAAQSTYTSNKFDYNSSWLDNTSYNGIQSWMWKRGQGCDIITYTGNGTAGRPIFHSLNQVPEMIWVKKRNDTSNWTVYNKGFNGGTNPEQYYLHLDESVAENTGSDKWNDTAPTSTHFTIGNSNSVNENTHTFIAMLFSSVTGISKVGSYTGTASQLQLRGLGFTPRFLLVKRVDGTGNWVVFDTTRGWGSGDDKKIFINSSAAQTTQDVGDPVSSGGGGFDLYSGNDDFNNTGLSYVYYAHA